MHLYLFYDIFSMKCFSTLMQLKACKSFHYVKVSLFDTSGHICVGSSAKIHDLMLSIFLSVQTEPKFTVSKNRPYFGRHFSLTELLKNRTEFLVKTERPPLKHMQLRVVTVVCAMHTDLLDLLGRSLTHYQCEAV